MFNKASPPKPALRTVAVVLAAIFAIAAPILIFATDFGLSAGEFEQDGADTLRAASYAFSIWSVIYLGLALYAIYQALPGTANGRWLDRLAWPSVVAMVGCGLWLVAAATDVKLATVLIIAISAAALIRPFWNGADAGHASTRQKIFIVWPLGLLAGWLTIATALNVLTVLTAWGVITPDNATLWAGGGIAAVVLAGLIITNRTRVLAYPIPIVWGLAAVYVAEQGDKPALAIAAAAGAALLGVFALVRCMRGSYPTLAHS